jgi:hypothetical protein
MSAFVHINIQPKKKKKKENKREKKESLAKKKGLTWLQDWCRFVAGG